MAGAGEVLQCSAGDALCSVFHFVFPCSRHDHKAAAVPAPAAQVQRPASCQQVPKLVKEAENGSKAAANTRHHERKHTHTLTRSLTQKATKKLISVMRCDNEAKIEREGGRGKDMDQQQWWWWAFQL